MIHWADGGVDSMQMVTDVFGEAVPAHFTRCGLQLGVDAIGVTDNAEDIDCPDCN